MTIKDISEKDKENFNKLATHPLQSYEWGQFRKAMGTKVIQKGFFEGDKLIDALQITLHPLPHTPWTIGYFPKGKLPTGEMLNQLYRIGKENNCIFIQLEPNVPSSEFGNFQQIITQTKSPIVHSSHPLFTKYTLYLDLTLSEDQLLKNMHSKTRYNIKIAQKHGVYVKEETSDEAFEIYWKLMEQTTNRQGFYAHTKSYHQMVWKTLQAKPHQTTNHLSAHLFIAYYQPESLTHPIPLVAWMVFVFHDMLYYPYGASSSEYRNVMAPNLIMWEVIKFGKKLGLKTFDMWGALGPNPDPKDPWFGFHRFKMGYRPEVIEFVGSYDLLINKLPYKLYTIADKARFLLLRFGRSGK